MISLGTNLNQFNKVSCSLRAQIISANSGKRIFQHNLGERVQICFAASHEGNFSLKKQIQFSGERTFETTRAFSDSLDATKRVRAPRDDQTRIAELSFPNENCLGAFHSPQT